MKAETTREQAIAVRVLEDVPAREAASDEPAGQHVRPECEVGARVGDDGRLARRAARCVDAHDLVRRHREEPERVVLPEVALGREGKPCEVLHRPEAILRNVGQSPAVEFGPRCLEPCDAGSHARHLQALELVARHGLGRTIPELLNGHACAPSRPCARLDAPPRRAPRSSPGRTRREIPRRRDRRPGW